MNENELYSPINKEHGPIVEFIEKISDSSRSSYVNKDKRKYFFKKNYENFQI